MKTVSILFFLTIALFASDNKDIMRAQILEKIISNISINETVTVWSDNKELLAELKKSTHIITSNDCAKATVIILENKEKIHDDACKNKPVFVLEYNLLKELPKSFGAFFWKKGRPNIVIIEPRIASQNISVSKELMVYVEEKVW